MPTVAEVVGEHQQRFGHGEFERERYGVQEPDAVGALVEAFVREQLGVGVAGCRFYAVSVGAVVGVEHVRLDGDRIVAVYDWARVKTLPETSFVGHAAHGFGIDLTAPDWRVPDRDDELAFVADCEAARGRPFTAEERRRVDASWLYAVAYSSRCEHSLLATDVDPVPHQFRERLAEHGPSLLA